MPPWIKEENTGIILQNEKNIRKLTSLLFFYVLWENITYSKKCAIQSFKISSNLQSTLEDLWDPSTKKEVTLNYLPC